MKLVIFARRALAENRKQRHRKTNGRCDRASADLFAIHRSRPMIGARSTCAISLWELIAWRLVYRRRLVRQSGNPWTRGSETTVPEDN